MNRWTNAMPYHFNNIDLYLNKTKKWYKEFTKEWQLMKDDYEKNKDTGKYENNMTSAYFPHETATPMEYGIIAIDLKNKKIYNSQDYCSIGELDLYKLYSQGYTASNKVLDKELLKQYYDNGFLKELAYYDATENQNKKIDISQVSFNDLVVALDEIKNNKMVFSDNNNGVLPRASFSHPLLKDIDKNGCDIYSVMLPISSEWKVVSYMSRSTGVLKVRQEMEKDGFSFTQEDNNSWKEYLSYAWYDQDEKDLKDDKEYQEFKTLYKEVFKEDFVIIREPINESKNKM